MKKKQRVMKRIRIQEVRRMAPSLPGSGVSQTDDPNCTAARVVYCNQWECHSHCLCFSDGSRSENEAVISEDK